MKRLPRLLLFGALVFFVVHSARKRNETNESLPKDGTKDTKKETEAYVEQFQGEIWSHSRLCSVMEEEFPSQGNG